MKGSLNLTLENAIRNGALEIVIFDAPFLI